MTLAELRWIVERPEAQWSVVSNTGLFGKHGIGHCGAAFINRHRNGPSYYRHGEMLIAVDDPYVGPSKEWQDAVARWMDQCRRVRPMTALAAPTAGDPSAVLAIYGRWFACSAADPRVVGIYSRHYSARGGATRREQWLQRGITAPGEQMVLLTSYSDALFVWTREKFRHDGQTGINCAVFRNESAALSSDLIREADDLAWQRWPSETRHFTYVDGSKVRSANPGYCFIKAGWRRCGHSKGGLLILEIER